MGLQDAMEIRLQGLRLGDDLVAGRDLTNHLHPWDRFQQGTQPIAKERMVIGNQQANRLHSSSSFFLLISRAGQSRSLDT